MRDYWRQHTQFLVWNTPHHSNVLFLRAPPNVSQSGWQSVLGFHLVEMNCYFLSNYGKWINCERLSMLLNVLEKYLLPTYSFRSMDTKMYTACMSDSCNFSSNIFKPRSMTGRARIKRKVLFIKVQAAQGWPMNSCCMLYILKIHNKISEHTALTSHHDCTHANNNTNFKTYILITAFF